MIKLERKRKGLKLLLAPFPIAIACLAFCLELYFPLALSLTVSGFVLVVTSIVLFKSSQKPAAWIENGVLKIRGGFTSTTKIALANVESMRYEVGQKVHNESFQRDSLFVKLKGFSEWDIPVIDETEHLAEYRLYHFIKDNFYDLPFYDPTN